MVDNWEIENVKPNLDRLHEVFGERNIFININNLTVNIIQELPQGSFDKIAEQHVLPPLESEQISLSPSQNSWLLWLSKASFLKAYLPSFILVPAVFRLLFVNPSLLVHGLFCLILGGLIAALIISNQQLFEAFEQNVSSPWKLLGSFTLGTGFISLISLLLKSPGLWLMTFAVFCASFYALLLPRVLQQLSKENSNLCFYGNAIGWAIGIVILGVQSIHG